MLSDSFGKSKSGYSEAGAIAKGIGKGNKVSNIPKDLESYREYLLSSQNAKWIRWQVEGNNSFSSVSNNCPYCTSSISEKKELVSRVGKEYDSKSIEHLNKITAVLDSLGQYFSKEANEQLGKIVNNVKGLSAEQKGYLLQIKQQTDLLKSKLLTLRGLTFYSIKDEGKLSDSLSLLKIDLPSLPLLNSQSTKNLVDPINLSLDKVLEQVGLLQGEVAKQTRLIAKTIEENKTSINGFLKSAGYKYYVDIEYSNEAYKMRLKHVDMADALHGGGQHLSYGEKNAFSLVLFMYYCLSRNPDIVILDDPISSFDRNKKYAVIDMLFRGARSLKGKTILMMTHDLEPVIDMLYTLPGNFHPLPKAAFIELKNGVLNEVPIVKSDLCSFGAICDEILLSDKEDVVKLTYLRRFYEITNNKELEYELLSNLLHKRGTPLKKKGDEKIPMTAEEIAEATEDIKTKFKTFDYNSMLKKLVDDDYMLKAYKSTESNYEKLQIFRVLRAECTSSSVINKYIKETFHIENEFIMQINPCKYEIVPAFIIEECDKSLGLDCGAVG